MKLNEILRRTKYTKIIGINEVDYEKNVRLITGKIKFGNKNNFYK